MAYVECLFPLFGTGGGEEGNMCNHFGKRPSLLRFWFFSISVPAFDNIALVGQERPVCNTNGGHLAKADLNLNACFQAHSSCILPLMAGLF